MRSWLRYVDDTFTAGEMDGFHEHVTRQKADIQFTKEIEENGKIPFLDWLDSRENNRPYEQQFRENRHTLTHY